MFKVQIRIEAIGYYAAHFVVEVRVTVNGAARNAHTTNTPHSNDETSE